MTGDCLEKVGTTLIHAIDEKQRAYFSPLPTKLILTNTYIPNWFTMRSFVHPALVSIQVKSGCVNDSLKSIETCLQGAGAYPANPVAFHYVKPDEHYLLEAVENIT